jgi:hypothetical protein
MNGIFRLALRSLSTCLDRESNADSTGRLAAKTHYLGRPVHVAQVRQWRVWERDTASRLQVQSMVLQVARTGQPVACANKLVKCRGGDRCKMLAARRAAPIGTHRPSRRYIVARSLRRRNALTQAGITMGGLPLLPTIARFLPQNGDVRQQPKQRHSASKGLPGYSRSGLDPFVRRESRATWR